VLRWQRQQGEPWIEISLLAQLLKAQPDHPINKRLQLLRQLGWSKVEAPVGHHNHNPQVLHLGVQLQKAEALGCKTVTEPNLGLHLHLEQHHRPLWRAALVAARPEAPSRR